MNSWEFKVFKGKVFGSIMKKFVYYFHKKEISTQKFFYINFLKIENQIS